MDDYRRGALSLVGTSLETNLVVSLPEHQHQSSLHWFYFKPFPTLVYILVGSFLTARSVRFKAYAHFNHFLTKYDVTYT